MFTHRRGRIGAECGMLVGAIVVLMLLPGGSTAWAALTGLDVMKAPLSAFTGAAIAPADDPADKPAADPPPQRRRIEQRETRDVERTYKLPAEKAKALFELLKFDDVKVLVGLTPEGAHIKGTAAEAKAIDGLVDLITREQGKEYAGVDAFIEAHRPEWTCSKTHQLPDDKRDALYSLLAMDDVPVLVSFRPGVLEAEASQADQRVITDVAEILRGMAPSRARKRVHRSDEAKPDDQAPARRRVERGDRRERNRLEREDVRDKREARRGGMMNELDALQEELNRQAEELNRYADELHREVERRAKELHEQADQLRAEVERIRREATGAAEKFESELDKYRRKQLQAGSEEKAEAAPEPRSLSDRERNRPDRVVTRKYELPAEHAEHLFNLFAPNDIRDVIVAREGNVIQVRATVRDHQTIKALVDILKRGE